MILTPQAGSSVDTPFELERYAASTTGKSVTDRIKAISQACSGLPVLDERSDDDILDYDNHR